MWRSRRTVTTSLSALIVCGALLGVHAPSAYGFQFRRGDVNLDDEINLTDAITILGVLFLGEQNPGCDDARDVDDDGQHVVSDAIYLLNFLFGGGAPPPPPYPDCGDDPTPDGFACTLRSKSCDSDSTCLGDDELTAAINEAVNSTECVEGDSAVFQIGDVTISVCPTVSADICDGRGTLGCPVLIDEIVASIALEERLVVADVLGSIVDMPVLIFDAKEQQECRIDLDFLLTAHVEFTTTVDLDGNLVVESVIDGVIADHEATLLAKGGFLCEALEAAQELFIDEIVAELERASDQIIGAVASEILGQPICRDR